MIPLMPSRDSGPIAGKTGLTVHFGGEQTDAAD
jgi:hypothetical protein